MANITTQTIRVDLSTDKVLPTAFTHQNDTARTLEFSMYNKGMPYTMTGNTVKFAYKSPIVDGAYTVITGSGMESGTVSGNKVTVTLPSTYTAISGVGMLTMIITPTSGTVRPVNIRFVVQSSADGDDTIAGASDFPDAWMDEKVYSWLDDHIDGVFSEEQFTDAVGGWLDDHPEATTTVQDHSLGYQKLINGTLNFVTPEMYGAKGDGTTDDRAAINTAIQSGKNVVFAPNKTYAVGFEIVDHTVNETATKRANYIIINNAAVIHGNNATLKLLTNPCGIYNGILIQNTSNVVVKDLKILGDKSEHTTTYKIDGYDGEWGHCLAVRNSSDITIENVHAADAFGDGLNVGGNSSGLVFNGCTSDNSRRNGMSITSAENVRVNNCIFKNTVGVAPQAGIDVEPDPTNGIILNRIILDGCTSYNNKGSGFEINTTAFGRVSSTEIPDVKVINCKSVENYYGITFMAVVYNATQAYEYGGEVLFKNCYILKPRSHGCLIQYEKPEKTAHCIIDGCVFDGYANFGVYGDLNHQVDSDTVWGGTCIKDSVFTNVPSDTGAYKCAIMWGTVGAISGHRYDLTVLNGRVDDSNPLYWGRIGVGHGKIEYITKPVVVQPSGYTHTNLNGLIIANRADNVGFVLPNRSLCDRTYELCCINGQSCFVARYGFGDSSIETNDKLISEESPTGSDYTIIPVGAKVDVIPCSTDRWLVDK